MSSVETLASVRAFDVPARFELRRLLGRGGMGTVHEAFDRERGELVALKHLARLDPIGVARIKHEFRVLAGLWHPNLVSLYELHEHEGRFFFTMELVEGVSFLRWVRPADTTADAAQTRPSGTEVLDDEEEEVLAQQRAATVGDVPSRPEPANFDEARLRDAIRQLARALFALHRAGKVHRDVKPSNVRVTPQGRLVLMDFGIAVARDYEPSAAAGTVAYMAPEQASGARAGPAADWYAAGVMIYEALAGRLPFASDVLLEKVSRDPTPPRRHAWPLPRDLEELCLALLVRDPDVRPPAQDVLSRLSERRRERPVELGRPVPLLVGREDTMDALGHAHLEVRRDPRARTIVLRGPASIGRTHVLEAFAEQVRIEGTLVLFGRCDERESIAYRGVDQWIDQLVDAESQHVDAGHLPRLGKDGVFLASLFPTVWELTEASLVELPARVEEPAEQRERAFAALTEWLRAVMANRAVLFLLDDAQWLDADGRALVAAVLDGCDRNRLAVLAVRTEGSEPVSFGLDADELIMPPLNDAAASALARELVGPAQQTVAAIVRAAEGRPGFLVELAAMPDGEIATGVEHVLTRRLDALGELPRALLALCALSYVPLEIDDACAVLGVDRTTLADAIAELRRAHLAHAVPQAGRQIVKTVSALVARAVRHNVPVETSTALHARLAKVLADRPGRDRGALARHRFEAGDREGAAHEAQHAAREAERALAFERAAELYVLAARADPERAESYFAKAGDAHAAAGRGREAASAYRSAAAHGSPDALHHRRRAAEELLRSGHVDDGMEELRDVLAAVGVSLPKSPARALPALLLRRAQLRLRGYSYHARSAHAIDPAELTRIDACRSAALGLLNIDVYRGAYFHALHILLALRAGEPHRVARALAFEAAFLAGSAGSERTEPLLAMAQGLARSLDSPYEIALAQGGAGLALVQQGRWREARDHLERAEAAMRERCRGAFWELATARIAMLWTLAFTGELRELRARLSSHHASAVAREDRFGATNLVVGMPVWAWLLTDEGERGQDVLRAAMSAWTRSGFHAQHLFYAFGQATIELYRGRLARAAARLDAAWPAMRRSQLLRNRLLRVVMHDLRGRIALARALRDSDARWTYVALARNDAAQIESEHLGWADGLARVLRAGIASVRGDREAAIGELTHAARCFDDAAMAMHAAVARDRLKRLSAEGEAICDSDWARREQPVALHHIVATIAPLVP